MKKIVVKMSLGEEQSRRKAMMLAVKVPGVASATVDKAKGQITITGDNVDPMAVAKALRGGGGKMHRLLCCIWPHHAVGPIDLTTVEEVKEEKKPAEEKKPPEPWSAYPYSYWAAPPLYQYVEVSQPSSWLG